MAKEAETTRLLVLARLLARELFAVLTGIVCRQA